MGVAGAELVEGWRVFVNTNKLLGTGGKEAAIRRITCIVISVVSGGETERRLVIAICTIIGEADNIFIHHFAVL